MKIPITIRLTTVKNNLTKKISPSMHNKWTKVGSAPSIPKWLNTISKGVISHMNEDHSNTIVSTLHAQIGLKDKAAKMISLQVNGYIVSSKGKNYFLTFEKECSNADEYKAELIKNAKKYRSFELL